MRAPTLAPVFISALVSLAMHSGGPSCSLPLVPAAPHLSVATQLTIRPPQAQISKSFNPQWMQYEACSPTSGIAVPNILP